LSRSALARGGVLPVLDLGYQPYPAIPGELVVAQAVFEKWRAGRLLHTIDVHWKIFNAFPFGHAPRGARGSSGDASAARHVGPRPVQRLAVHRIAHHFDSDHLIWLYDIGLIARSLIHCEWREFAALVRARKVAVVCRRSLECAIDRFDTNVPDGSGPTCHRATPRKERTARYLARRTLLGVVLRTLSRWRDRWRRLVREHTPLRPLTYAASTPPRARRRCHSCTPAPPTAWRTEMAREAALTFGCDS
jgi:hypothetical protein